MSPRRLVAGSAPFVVCVGVAALFPLSAYAVSLQILPALLIGGGLLVLVLVRPEYGIAGALALAPLTNLVVGSHKPFQLIVPALALGVAVYGSLVGTRDRVRTAAGGVSLSVFAFLLAAIASAMGALAPSASVKKIVILLVGTALFFAVLEICRDRRRLLVVTLGAVGGLFVAGVHGVAQHYLGFRGVAGFVVNGTLVSRVQGAFGHPNQYGGYLAFLIPLAIVIALSRALPGRARAISLAALAVGVPGLIFSYARGAILGVILGLLVWLAVLRPRAALGIGLAVAVIGFAFVPSTLKQRFDPQAAGSDVPLRADIWGAAVDIYSTAPVLGVGVNNFGEAYKSLPSTLPNATQRRLLDEGALRTPPHAQNLYLNVLAEEGAVGGAALILLLGAALTTFYRCSRLRDPVARAIGLGCGAGFVAMLFHSLLELTLFTELTLPFMALLAVTATFVALEREGAEASDARSA